MLSSTIFTVLSLTLVATAHPGHEHRAPHALPGTWYHARDHPVEALFKRYTGGDGQQYPDIGSPEWLARYPNGPADPNAMPNEWKAALKAAEDAGKIPNIVHSTSPGPGINPVYPPGTNALGPEICSATQKCIHPEDVWNGPDGTYGTSFDDGPLPFSIKLLDFLKSKNEGATHFMIGITMLQNVEPLKATLATGNDLAVHTWNHPYMTTLSNADIVAQLGWNMQIIHDSTGGKVPRFWRPPYGDSDNRVRAIAQQVFGLKTVIWNRDTRDWGLPTGDTKAEDIKTQYAEWVTGPKSPGLIVLEHETSEQSVQAFIDAYPSIKSNGWNTKSLVQLIPGVDNKVGGAYRNVAADGKVTAATILFNGAIVAPSGSVAPPPPPPSSSSGPTSTKAVPPSSSGTPRGSASGVSPPAPSNNGASRGAGVAISLLAAIAGVMVVLA